MRFQITLNMPAFKSGRPVHQITAEYPVNSLEEFIQVLNSNDMVIVEEMYRNDYTNEYRSHGYTAINYRWVGKVRVHNDQTQDHD